MNEELNYMLREYERVRQGANQAYHSANRIAKLNGDLVHALNKVMRADTLGAAQRTAEKALNNVPTLVDKLPI